MSGRHGWQWRMLVGWLWMLHYFFLLSDCRHHHGHGRISRRNELKWSPVQLHVKRHQVVMGNGFVNVTLSKPGGMVTGIQYNGIDNLLENSNKADNRGYWDVVWNKPGSRGGVGKLAGTKFKIILQNRNQVEISFTRKWNSSNRNNGMPLNVDKRFIMLRGTSGFYSYAIFERFEGWPALTVDQARIAFKLEGTMFHYMALSDTRQRIMPGPRDRSTGKVLDYPEAVLLTKPTNSELKGQVDDKYQYSIENKDNRVHGWICNNPGVGFWMITPSDEFRTGGPLKQDLTSHVGPTVLSMFASTHYAGEDLGMNFEDGEPWKKVFGPVFVYLNQASANENPYHTLWVDAKTRMMQETARWPYSFPVSEDFPHSDKRGILRGRLLVRERYPRNRFFRASSAYIGLALPGEAGSWQRENKGYQFWTRADAKGIFWIKGVRAGNYNLYAWVPGFIGDFKYNVFITITPGRDINLGDIFYEPPRNGPTLWQIGFPDRSAAEFYVPDPNPRLENPLYEDCIADKFRQYGLWNRYTDIYSHNDLVYTVGSSDYRKDWFFAHVNRNIGHNQIQGTTWQIVFELEEVNNAGIYTLQLALASANFAEVQVRVNNPESKRYTFRTGLIGKDNAIARHGIHGLYWLFSIGISGSQLISGGNTIFLTQSRSQSPFQGVMYDYIRLEAPPG